MINRTDGMDGMECYLFKTLLLHVGNIQLLYNQAEVYLRFSNLLLFILEYHEKLLSISNNYYSVTVY